MGPGDRYGEYGLLEDVCDSEYKRFPDGPDWEIKDCCDCYGKMMLLCCDDGGGSDAKYRRVAPHSADFSFESLVKRTAARAQSA